MLLQIPKRAITMQELFHQSTIHKIKKASGSQIHMITFGKISILSIWIMTYINTIVHGGMTIQLQWTRGLLKGRHIKKSQMQKLRLYLKKDRSYQRILNIN